MPVTLQDLGWNDHFQRAFDAVAKPGWMPGRLIRETKINFTALLDGGEDVDAVVSGKLWHDAATDAELPAVGDWVAIDPGEAGDEAVIRSILPRQTCFSRSSWEKQRGTGIGNQCGYRGRSDGAGNGLQPQAHGALLYTHPPQRSISSHPA